MRCSEAAPAGKKEALPMAGAKRRAKKPVGRDRVLFNILSYAVLTALSAACLLPFLLVLSGSVSEQYSIQLHGYRLFPETISLDAYKMLFRIPQELLRAYGVTIFVTAVGTVLGLWLTSMAAYVLSSRDFRYRYQVSFFFYFTSIFGGGLVPWYIFNTKYLHFHNSVIALILPILINVTYLLILKSYMTSIPEALYESAKLDGCGNLRFIVKILIPLTKSAIGAMAVYTFINAWNMYMWPLLVTGSNERRTVQIGISMLDSVDSQSITLMIAGVVMIIIPSISIFIIGQKQLIRGMFSGAVKG